MTEGNAHVASADMKRRNKIGDQGCHGHQEENCILAYSRGLRTRWSESSLPTQTVLWFCNSMILGC